ncbi:glycosyltransferase [Trichodesmium erythraeum 21-75]|nr:glycosyltransferase [Trichodesmium erythraeum 21-75]
MYTGMSYGEKQKRYQSLVREAWEKYQKGSYTKMAKLLSSSLLYTPYLKAETVVDWVTKLTHFSTEKNVLFDADFLSDLEPWNQALSSSPSEAVAAIKPVDTYYIFNNKEDTKKLTDESIWITVPVSEASHYNIEGTVFSKKESPKKALIQVQFLEPNLKPIPGSIQGLSNSGELGPYIYLNPNPDVKSFKLEIYIPDSVSYLKLGFRTWHNFKPIFIGSKIKVTQVKSAAWIPSFKYPQPKPTSNLVIATLLDRFSEDCWKYEANIIPLDKSSWQQQLEDNKPAFFFAESIWQGNDGKWVGSMTKYAEKKSNPLRDIINYCKAQKIPTVFWNKEDPPNFDVFIDVAKEFDYIFTTDENCVKAYQEICGHNRVYSLPFAAQPYIHNPAGKPKELKEICFAGSWFANKHPERRELLPTLLDPALHRGLHIFDRMLNQNREDYRFPEKYQQAIVGTLDLEQVLMAYRSYKVFLNVNTVTNSPTMFSRRVFELLACGTPVISTQSVGVQKMLGDFVKITHNYAETNEHIDVLLNDEEVRQKLAHTGYRYVHENHTYKHRLEYILGKLQIKDKSLLTQPLVSVVAATNRPEYLENCLENYTRQKYTHKELLLVLNNNSYNLEEVRQKVSSLPNVKVFQVDEEKTLGECLNLGVDNSIGDYIAKFDDDDLYGSHFLGDMILPFSYTNAAIVGKQTYYGYLESQNKLVVRFLGREHLYTKLVSGGTMVIKRQVFDRVRFPYKPFGTDTAFLKSCAESELKIWSSDKYNFIQVRKPDTSKHTWKIDEQDYLKKCQVVSNKLNLAQVMS